MTAREGIVDCFNAQRLLKPIGIRHRPTRHYIAPGQLAMAA